ncbi:MAG: ATP-dependent helicase [Oleibacter sp.]|nr:ATP-dependent helicase [Thalassolituus sp.]
MSQQPTSTNTINAPGLTSDGIGLTQEQSAVVAHTEGHARVIAVAGAGKTATLTHFVLARLADGISARRMLVLMYNKAAQREFQQRLEALSGQVAQSLPQVRTFHSLGLKIYQALVEQGALPAWQGKILSDGEIEGIVWRLLQQLADDDTRQDILSQRKKWVEPAVSFIDVVKSGLLPAADVFEAQNLPPQCRLFIELFYQFEDWRKQQRRISYNDMLYDPVMCLRAHPDVADRFAGHMQWILVDEYQDINEVQQTLLTQLYGGRGAVMVIGDPDQTIYEFRGSRPEFITSEFEQNFGQSTTFHLPHTFRYGSQLTLMANHLIHHNQQREPLIGLSHSSVQPTFVKLHAARSDAALTVYLIRAHLESLQTSPDQHQKQIIGPSIAVIHRVWSLCAPIELALLQAGIDYHLDHSQSVLERWELRIFWLLLEVSTGALQQRDRAKREDAWLHILTHPFPKIRRAELEQIAAQVSQATQNLGEALLAAIPASLSQWQRQQLEVRAQLIANAEIGKLNAGRLFKDYVSLTELDKGIEDSAFSQQQIEDRQATLRAFLRYTDDLALSPEDMLVHWRTLRDKIRQRQQDHQHNPAAVVLTSAHKSKGREWDCVIIPGVNAHYFPYQAEGEFTTPASIESERRLLYVSMTRARKQLHLLLPSHDKPLDRKDLRTCPSPFQFEFSEGRSKAVNQALFQAINQVPANGTQLLELHPQDGPIAKWLLHYIDKVAAGRVNVTLAPVRHQPPSTTENIAIRQGGVVDKKFQQPPRRLQHESLGMGTLISEDDQYLRVRFDNAPRIKTLARAQVLDKLVFLS